MACVDGCGFNGFIPDTIYYNLGDTIMFNTSGEGGNGGSGFDTSPILEEVDMLEDDIDMVEDYDGMVETVDEEAGQISNLQLANARLQNENASLQNEEVQLKSQLAGTDRRMHELEDRLAEKPGKNKETNVDTTTDDVLGTPTRRDAFFVGKTSFETKNEALQYEVLQALVEQDWTNHDEYDEDSYDSPLERLRETYQIPLGTLADNIDRIASILREYEQKKDR